VCLHDNLKTTADICILLGAFVDYRKSQTSFASQDHRSRSFFGGLRVTQ